MTSLAFGTGVPEKELGLKRDYWLRFDYTKDLILATGHTNGRIRVWDPYTGEKVRELEQMREICEIVVEIFFYFFTFLSMKCLDKCEFFRESEIVRESM